MILGGDDSPGIVAELQGSSKIKIVPTQPNWKDQIINKEIRAAVEIPPDFQSAVARQANAVLLIHNYEGDLKSSIATDNIQKSLEKYRDRIVHDNLAARNVPDTALKPFEIKENNVAPPEKVGGAAFGGVIGYMVILLCLVGSMYPAMDLTAGEKERGTMETILSSPISRVDLVFGKFSRSYHRARHRRSFRNLHGCLVRCPGAPPRLRQGRRRRRSRCSSTSVLAQSFPFSSWSCRSRCSLRRV